MSASHTHTHTPLHDFTGQDPAFRRALWVVITLNFAMFLLEMGAGHVGESQSLQADALDFFGDSVTYGLSLAVIGLSPRTRARAALCKGLSLLAFGAIIFANTLYHVFVPGAPVPLIMGTVGIMALLTNLLSVALLYKWRDGDANIRSVWLCSRSDALGNIAVLFAALGVMGTGTRWPDLIVGALMAGLFLYSAVQILGQARHELHHADGAHHD